MIINFVKRTSSRRSRKVDWNRISKWRWHEDEETTVDLYYICLSPSTRTTYQILMTNRARKGDMDGAREILMKIAEKKFPLTRSIIRTLIMGFGEQG